MDAGWVAVIVGILAICVTIWIYLLQRNRKVIAYQVISDTVVLSIKEGKDVHGRVEVLFDKKPVKDVHVVILRLWNSGNAPIKREDYDKNNPIEIECGEDAKVLEVEVLDTTPKSIEAEVKASLTFSDENISIAPVLLNPHSSIKLKILLTKFKGKITMDKMGIIGGYTRNWDKSLIGRAVKDPRFLMLVGMLVLALSPFLSIPLLLIVYYSLFYLNVNINYSFNQYISTICYLITLLILALILLILIKRKPEIKEVFKKRQ